MPTIYKILRQTEWESLHNVGEFTGSQVDVHDGFIHLSYADQVAETARKHFSGEGALFLCAFDSEIFGTALKAEPSRGGALFPHLYAPLPLSHLVASWPLARDAAGIPIIPPLD